MRRSATRASAPVLATVGLAAAGVVAGLGATPAAPAFAAQGVTVQVTQLPGVLTADGRAAVVLAQATKSGGDCVRLRWSLGMQVTGVRLDRVRVDRFEGDDPFPVRFTRQGVDAGRLADQRTDPQQLCRDRPATARWTIKIPPDAVDGSGRFTLQVDALDGRGKRLDRTTVTRDVRGRGPVPSGTPPAGPDGAGAASAAPGGAQASGSGGGAGADRASSQSSVARVGPIGLGVGAVLVLTGFVLLMRVRRRSREAGVTIRRA